MVYNNYMKTFTDSEQMNMFLSDESRRAGTAQAVCFPETEADIIDILRSDAKAPVTVQGGRTGVTAGAVPDGGRVINLSAMNRILRLPETDYAEHAVDSSSADSAKLASHDDTALTAFVQPGVLLCHLQEKLAPLHLFFPPDPTETTASIGGMVSCNSSGARTYRYGATRHHIRSLRMVLSDGDTLTLRRGECVAKSGRFSIVTDSGRRIEGQLPDIRMPQVSKHTAGYFIRPDMDLIDLFIRSEGTLGIVTEIECALLPESKELWGAIAFFEDEAFALRYVHLLRGESADSTGEAFAVEPMAIEFFGTDTLNMLRGAQKARQILTDMSEIPAGCAVYTEFTAESREVLEPLCKSIGRMIQLAGGDPGCSWFAFRGPDMNRLKAFRHAAPVCVNEQISQIRKTHPQITKLGTDMSVPDACLDEVFAMYRGDLTRGGFMTSVFGHIGNNHLHCNIIPRDEDEYLRGKALYTDWAEEVVRLGGSVSAEHGIGKLKPWLLQKLYSPEELGAMRELKRLFDPQMRLNPGNLFGKTE